MTHPRELAAARVLAGWSQEELASRTGVGVSTIKAFEAGSRDIKTSTLRAIVKAYRQHGIILLSTERLAAGIAIVRGTPADWLDAEDGPVAAPDEGEAG